MQKNSKELLVSIITLNYNRKNDVLELLANCMKQTYRNFEVVVVDNASSDGSVSAIKKRFPKTKVIARQVGRGYASYNLGLKAAKGDYFVILDSDTEIGKDLCTQVVKKFKKNREVGVLAFKILDYDTKSESQKAPRKKTGSRRKGFEALTLNGCGWAMRREVYDKVGGVIEGYFLYCNEYEYGVRVLEAGFDIRYFPDLVIYHKTGQSQERSSGKAGFYQARNWIYFLLEFVPLSSAVQFLPFLRKTSHKRGRKNPKIFRYYLMGMVVGFFEWMAVFVSNKKNYSENTEKNRGGSVGDAWVYLPMVVRDDSV